MHRCIECNSSYSRNRLSGIDICPICLFWINVDVRGPDDCWLWRGKLDNKSYGEFLYDFPFGRREKRAHRVSWAIFNGEIPNGFHVLHCCDNRYNPGDFTNRHCVNPSHLRLGTNYENVLDRIRNGRGGKACGELNGHIKHPELTPRGELHKSAKLTEDQVIEILRSQGSLANIARTYGISATHVGRIKKGQAWKCLKFK